MESSRPSGKCLHGFSNESSDQLTVLTAVFTFQAGMGIHAGGFHMINGLTDIVRCQAAGQKKPACRKVLQGHG